MLALFTKQPAKKLEISLPESRGSDREIYMEILMRVIEIGFYASVVYFGLTTIQWCLKELISDKSKEALEMKRALAKRLNRPEVEDMNFDKYEQKLMIDVIGPEEIDVTFDSIGGMDQELEEVKDNIVLPFQISKFYKTLEGVSACPTGVLLYGAPGTGKSLTAKAIAREAGATFISIKASSVMDKWFGESDKLVSALFRLGRKLAPSVIFIDEIETLLKKRNVSESNSGMHSMQGTFLSEWDGLSSASPADKPAESPGKVHESAAAPKSAQNMPVIVLGATNRPNDLDKAFLRRMPVQIQTKVPNLEGRVGILRAQLAKEALGEDVDLHSLAARTEAFTGSDIRELVRVANLQRIKSYLGAARAGLKVASQLPGGANAVKNEMSLSTRPLSGDDFEYALNKTVAAAKSTKTYGAEIEGGEYLDKARKEVAAYQKALNN